MKRLPKYNHLLLPIGLPLLLITLACAFFFRTQMLQSFTAQGLLLFFTLIIAVSPLGKIRLGNATPMPSWRWVLSFFTAGTGILFLFYGLVYIAKRGIPVAVPEGLPVSSLSAGHLIFSWGCFPWFLILSAAISLAYFSFVQGKPGRLSTPLAVLFKAHENDAISLLADFFTRGAIAYCITSSLAIINLVLLSFFLHWAGIPLMTGVRISTLTIVTLFILLPSWRISRKSLRFLLQRKIPYGAILLIYVTVMPVLLLCAYSLSDVIGAAFAGWNENRQLLPNLNWQQVWLVFIGMWWLSWIAVMSGLLVYLSRGFSIRKMIAFGILVIILLQLVLFCLTALPRFQHATGMPLVLPLIGFFLVLGFFFRQEYFVYMMRGTIPTTAHEKPRSLFIPLQKILQNATLLTVLYLLTGIYLPALFSVLMLLPFTVLVLLSILAITKR